MGAKKSLSAFLFFCLFLSCKKDGDGPPPAPGSLLLSEISSTNSANAQVNLLTMEYDSQDRLSRVYSTAGNEPQRLFYEIRYPAPSTVTVREGNIDPDYTREFEFILDGSGRPTSRFERILTKLDRPSYFQRTVTENTTNYTYGADGFLERTVKRWFDSTNAPGTASGIRRQTSTDTAFYTNSGGNLSYATSSGNDTIVTYSPGPISVRIRRERSREDFDYSMKIPLGNYGKNAFLYQELLYLGITGQPNYLPYLNMANKASRINEVLEPGGNWAFGSQNLSEFLPGSVLSYNEQKLITRIQFKDAVSGITYTTDYSYR